MNSWMLFVCPKPGITSVQNSSNKVRNCDSEVQNKTESKLAWELWPTFPLILTAFSSTIKEVAEIPFKGKTKQQQQNTFIAVWLLKPGHLEEDFLIPLISLRFLKTRFSSFFFCKWSNKIQDSTIQPLHWTLWNRLNLPDLSGNNPQIYDPFWSVWKKKLENLLF